MIDYMDNDAQNESPINVYIGEEEWQNYSFQNKVRLLYRLRQSDIPLAQLMAEPLGMMIDYEQKQHQIDIEATIKRCEDVSKWPD